MWSARATLLLVVSQLETHKFVSIFVSSPDIWVIYCAMVVIVSIKSPLWLGLRSMRYVHTVLHFDLEYGDDLVSDPLISLHCGFVLCWCTPSPDSGQRAQFTILAIFRLGLLYTHTHYMALSSTSKYSPANAKLSWVSVLWVSWTSRDCRWHENDNKMQLPFFHFIVFSLQWQKLTQIDETKTETKGPIR